MEACGSHNDMLTIYSTYGSPGASTTAIYLAAQWASSGQQVLLIEADSASGSLSQKLGVQFTPGTASFVASGKPVSAENLIEHAQDILFSDLHVMPTPSSPSGAKSIAESLADLGDKLRDISDSEMAVVIDGGRLTPEARTSQLTTSAAGVLVVARNNTQLSSLEHLDGVLARDPSEPGPLGYAVCIGSSPYSSVEWQEQFGLSYIGSIVLAREGTTDLSMFLSRGKRKFRKLRSSLEQIADSLGDVAFPRDSVSRRPRLAPVRDEADETGDSGEAEETGEAVSPTNESRTPMGVDATEVTRAPTDPTESARTMPQAQSLADDIAVDEDSPPPLRHPEPTQPQPQYGHLPQHYDPPPQGQYGHLPQHYDPPPQGQPGHPYGHPEPTQPQPQYGHLPQHYDPPPQGQPGYPDNPYGQPDVRDHPYRDPGAAHYDPAGGYLHPDAHHTSSVEQPYGGGVAGQFVSQPAQYDRVRRDDFGVGPHGSGADHDGRSSPAAGHVIPTQPTGSFRSWAEQLYGDEARNNPGDGWPPPNEGVTA